MQTCFEFLTNDKHFLKTVSQWQFDYGLFTKLPRILAACNFSPNSSNYFRNKQSNLKTTWHTKPKIFLCTKLLENVLLEKYLKSVIVALNLWWLRLKNLVYCTDYNRNTFVTMKVLAILTNRGCFLLNLEFNKLFPLIFNFNSFVSSTDVDKFIAHSDSIPCHCTGSSFIDKDHKHL